MTKTEIEQAFIDLLFLPVLVCQASNEVDSSWDTSQIKWHQCRDKTDKLHKIIIFELVSEVFDKFGGFFRLLLRFNLARVY